MAASTAPAETLDPPSSLAFQGSTVPDRHGGAKEDREHDTLAGGAPSPSPPRLTVCQNPVSVTLDGPAIFGVSLSVVLLLRLVGPGAVELLVSLVPVALLIRNDFHNFLLLGRGGTSSTVQGYLKICCLRLLCLRDPFKAPRADPTRLPREGILARKAALPYRPGPRPLVAGIAPQRQLDQRGSQGCYLALRRAMERLALRRPREFGTERSCLEKHGLALFARFPLQTNCQGEICHVHDSDHSMHLCLHPNDSKEILQKGWGQRHPLAREEEFLRMPVSRDFVMIYAPRDDQELQIVCRIISAAIWYILCEDVDFDVETKVPLNLVLSSQVDK
ncbi:hypothetical protein ESCO_004761 [Escovopsis weberi]|uniref:Luciferase domain-containing protein n=1 Tax=Escovopsis weberi TaxID=150374 RepID=A0A0M9VRM0_ESCWE|nr:hypothetical protein ESCO_004761 [Escovopsis weberi]